MEALKTIVANVPDWLKRLEDLSGQIEQRQIDLAKLIETARAASPDGCSTAPKSIRNKGSTESLKARDEPEAHPRDITLEADNDAAIEEAKEVAKAAGAAAAKATTDEATPSSPTHSQTPSALQRQSDQVKAAGRARARATLRKRQRTDSVISAEGATPKYRTRSMIIVYYDSYVQMFFEELVKFVSNGRNQMRKAKMAAKVAQIKKMALDMPDDDDDNEDDKPAPPPSAGGDGPIEATPTAALAAQTAAAQPPPVQYVSARRTAAGPHAMMARTSRGMYMRAGGRRGGGGELGPDGKPAPPSVYDELDKGLEYVQSMCEHAAHQFLRDGDCVEEVANIKRRMVETKELADREMERVKKEEPEALEAAGAGGGGDEIRGRSFRPQSMRKEVAKPVTAELEVDEGIMEVDEEQPKLVYKSTRMMT